jgi:hypothetical protein
MRVHMLTRTLRAQARAASVFRSDVTDTAVAGASSPDLGAPRDRRPRNVSRVCVGGGGGCSERDAVGRVDAGAAQRTDSQRTHDGTCVCACACVSVLVCRRRPCSKRSKRKHRHSSSSSNCNNSSNSSRCYTSHTTLCALTHSVVGARGGLAGWRHALRPRRTFE